METALIQYGLPAAALLVFASAMGIPTGIPIKAVLLAVGALLVRSPAELPVAFAVLLMAEVAGLLGVLTVGRFGGGAVLRRVVPDGEAKAAAVLARWRARVGGRDPLAIFALRLVPVVRIGVTAAAGALGLRLRDVLLGAVPAACLWIGLPLGLGFAFRDDLRTIETAIAGAVAPAAAVAAAALLGLVALRTKAIGDGR